MNIGAAAKASGVNAKMIRYYESVGLLRPAARQNNSYRDYGPHDVHELRFIGRARSLGFALDEIETLLALWRDRGRPSREVQQVASTHLQALEARIGELRAMAGTLRHLISCCHADDRPDCPILDELGGPHTGAGDRSGSGAP